MGVFGVSPTETDRLTTLCVTVSDGFCSAVRVFYYAAPTLPHDPRYALLSICLSLSACSIGCTSQTTEWTFGFYSPAIALCVLQVVNIMP